MSDPKYRPDIDAHVHVWDRSCGFVAGARYHPDYEATIDDYLRVLDGHGIERAVLVQPSFLGTDNSYLLGCLSAHPDRLRGIVVLNPDGSDAELEDMKATGVIGHRYNMVGRDVSVLREDRFRALTHSATGLGWWTEVQANGQDWPQVIENLQGARLMVDHFGLPSGVTCPGIAALELLDPATISLKLSAPYRQSNPNYLEAMRPLLITDPMPSLLWGSDWPWTQHEDRHSYRDCVEWLEGWTTVAERAQISAASVTLGF